MESEKGRFSRSARVSPRLRPLLINQHCRARIVGWNREKHRRGRDASIRAAVVAPSQIGFHGFSRFTMISTATSQRIIDGDDVIVRQQQAKSLAPDRGQPHATFACLVNARRWRRKPSSDERGIVKISRRINAATGWTLKKKRHV